MRQEIRVRLDEQDDEIVATLVDLSVGGIGVQCTVETSAGVGLDFEFYAPATGEEIRGRGRVAWVRPARSTFPREDGLVEVGVQFDHLTEASRRVVERIVRSECGLKTDLASAAAEIARLRFASQKSEKRSRVQLDAMRQSIHVNAEARRRVEGQLREAGALELDLGDAEELLGLGKLAADQRRREEEFAQREESVRLEIETMKATIAEFESDDAKERLKEVTLSAEAGAGKIALLVESQRRLEEELEEAREATRESEGLLVEASDQCRQLEREKGELEEQLLEAWEQQEGQDQKTRDLEETDVDSPGC